MLSPTFFINVFYLVLFCVHVCVDDVMEKIIGERKFGERIRMPKFGTTNALFRYFWASALKANVHDYVLKQNFSKE